MSTTNSIVEVRRFSDASIQGAIDDALAKLPSGKKGAVVAYADLDGVKLAAVGKIGDHWSLVGVLNKEWNKPLEAAAEVRFTW